MKGTFNQGVLNGLGERVYKSGKTLTGSWQNNQLVTGKMINSDGTTYEGEWVGGRPHGEGIKTLPGGKKYEGMFNMGRPWGRGFKVAGLERIAGYWENSKWVKGETPMEKLQEFNEQLQKITTYFNVF